MTAASRYFCRRVVGVAATEYCLLAQRTRAGQVRQVVTAVLYSRPDGIEVERPAGVVFDLPPPASSLKGEQRGMAGHLHGTTQAVSAMRTKTCPECNKTRPLAQFISSNERECRRCNPCRQAAQER